MWPDVQASEPRESRRKTTGQTKILQISAVIAEIFTRQVPAKEVRGRLFVAVSSRKLSPQVLMCGACCLLSTVNTQRASGPGTHVPLHVVRVPCRTEPRQVRRDEAVLQASFRPTQASVWCQQSDI